VKQKIIIVSRALKRSFPDVLPRELPLSDWGPLTDWEYWNYARIVLESTELDNVDDVEGIRLFSSESVYLVVNSG
jgi:hypothetical protein